MMLLRDTSCTAVLAIMKLLASVSTIFSFTFYIEWIPELVEKGKGASDSRLTYLLRPNVTRPDRRAPAGLETPPVTDIDYSSNPETDDNIDSDFISDRDVESDVELDHNTLPAIEESPNPALSPLPEDEWSHIEEENVGESDFDEFDSGSEAASALSTSVDVLRPRLEALSLGSPLSPAIIESQVLPSQRLAQNDPDRTVTDIRPQLIHSASSPRRREWTSSISARSTSSPSRSPARMRPRRHAGFKKRLVVNGSSTGRSFYEYLFL